MLKEQSEAICKLSRLYGIDWISDLDAPVVDAINHVLCTVRNQSLIEAAHYLEDRAQSFVDFDNTSNVSNMMANIYRDEAKSIRKMMSE